MKVRWASILLIQQSDELAWLAGFCSRHLESVPFYYYNALVFCSAVFTGSVTRLSNGRARRHLISEPYRDEVAGLPLPFHFAFLLMKSLTCIWKPPDTKIRRVSFCTESRIGSTRIAQNVWFECTRLTTYLLSIKSIEMSEQGSLVQTTTREFLRRLSSISSSHGTEI